MTPERMSLSQLKRAIISAFVPVTIGKPMGTFVPGLVRVVIHTQIDGAYHIEYIAEASKDYYITKSDNPTMALVRLYREHSSKLFTVEVVG